MQSVSLRTHPRSIGSSSTDATLALAVAAHLLAQHWQMRPWSSAKFEWATARPTRSWCVRCCLSLQKDSREGAHSLGLLSSHNRTYAQPRTMTVSAPIVLIAKGGGGWRITRFGMRLP